VEGKNIELLVQLSGKYSRVGKPDSWIEAGNGIRDLLEEYQPQENIEEKSSVPEALRIEEVRKTLSRVRLELRCTRVEGGWSLELHTAERIELEGVHVSAWPLSRPREHAADVPLLDPTSPVVLGTVEAGEITTLTGFRLAMGDEEACFALDLPLSGGPEDRVLSVLGGILRNREAFVRYLLLLLADLGQLPEPAINGNNANGTGGRWRSSDANETPLFEMLAQAWSREPARLKDVAALVDRLSGLADENGEPLLPAEFMAVWNIFREAMGRDVETSVTA
jgi:hypothetical protein